MNQQGPQFPVFYAAITFITLICHMNPAEICVVYFFKITKVHLIKYKL